MSDLNLKIATRVAAMENDAKRVDTRPAILATWFKLGKDRNVTDALNTIAACMGGDIKSNQIGKRGSPRHKYTRQ